MFTSGRAGGQQKPINDAPSVKSAKLGLSLNSRQHVFASCVRKAAVATSGLFWLKSQYRWLMNMKRLFNVKSLWFFSQIYSFHALWAIGKSEWGKEKGDFNQNTKCPCLIPFYEFEIRVLNVCLWIQGLFLFVWGRRVGWMIRFQTVLLAKVSTKGKREKYQAQMEELRDATVCYECSTKGNYFKHNPNAHFITGLKFLSNPLFFT